MTSTVLAEIRAGRHSPADCTPYVITDHAVEQYNLRIGRHLDLDVARKEFIWRLSRAEVSQWRPSWIRGRRREHLWLYDDGMACPMDKDFTIKSVFTPDDDAPTGATVRWVNKSSALPSQSEGTPEAFAGVSGTNVRAAPTPPGRRSLFARAFS